MAATASLSLIPPLCSSVTVTTQAGAMMGHGTVAVS